MASSSKMINLMSSDGQTFAMEEAVAVQSQTISQLIEDDCASNVIPVPNVTGKILALIIEYCNKHAESPATVCEIDRKTFDESLKAWDAQFMKVDRSTLFDLLTASNYLDIRSLFDLACQTVADMIKNKSPEEVRKLLNIKNDLSPEEEEAIRKENEWAFTDFCVVNQMF